MLLEKKHRSEAAKQPQSVDGVQGLRSLRLPTRSSLRRQWELPPWPRRNWGIVDLWANGTFCCQGICKKTGIYTAFTIIIIISYLIYGSFLHIFPQTTVQKAWWGNAIVQWCHTFHTLPADFQYWWATAPRSLKQPLWIEYFKQQYKPGANTSQRTRPILYNYVSFTLCFFLKISAIFETMWHWISDSSSWRPFLLQFSVDRHPLSLDDFWRSWAISCKMGSQLQTCGCFGVGGHFKQREGDHHQHQ